ncbi:LysR substrate-binding domain-containing protein [Ideonella sp. BN130291]|uniref:LysR substrate-binding domain-containing protein n=1 Tax=Ideonella sp. BN130291 TaxID=3112940 RepID=UPI002E25F291|nr:LysR substrate-binding domain-containing protein [Ideonella sp. BN130291]
MPRLPRLPLQNLAAFRAAARLQNLRAAAEELSLTHGAVSQQIRGLEEQLGFELFHRHGRRIELNAAGEALLQGVERAWVHLDDAVHMAAAASGSTELRLRLTTLPSFAQHWLMPRIARWRDRHPDIALELEASHRVIDLQREGFHAAVRQGRGPWPGLQNELLAESPFVAVGAPATARRLIGAPPEALAEEPLLGDVDSWTEWFAAFGIKRRIVPVASFNDAGLMLQAAEQGLGIALARELLAADALADNRLMRLSSRSITLEGVYNYHLVYPLALRDWPPLVALRGWLMEELEASGARCREKAA